MQYYLAISPNIEIENNIIIRANNLKHAKETLSKRISKHTILQQVKLIELKTGFEKNYFIEKQNNI
jgi:hypothetical protein